MALVMILILIIFAAIVVSKNPASELNLWMGIYAILSIIGTFGVFIEERNVSGFMYILKGIFDSASYYLAPHAFLMLGITFKFVEWTNYKRIIIVAGVLTLFPVVILYLLYPPAPFEPNFLLLAVYASSYYFAAIALMVNSFVKEKRLLFRGQKFLVIVIVVPIILSETIVSFILRAFGFPNLQIINQTVTIIQFAIFCFVVVKNGFMGIRIRFEGLDVSMRNISTGTTIFNHTVKNEMNKIAVALYTVKSSINDSIEGKEALDVISSSVKHMREMAEKIKSNSKEIKLEKEKFDILICIEEALKNLSSYIINSNVKIERKYNDEFQTIIKGDRVYLQEVFQNVFLNAIESFDDKQNAIISIEIRKNKKSIKLIVSDNGKGIPKGIISKVFDPFFSTKSSKNNYGLGMTFCYNAVEKHGGIMDIESEEGRGTSILIKLPKEK